MSCYIALIHRSETGSWAASAPRSTMSGKLLRSAAEMQPGKSGNEMRADPEFADAIVTLVPQLPPALPRGRGD